MDLKEIVRQPLNQPDGTQLAFPLAMRIAKGEAAAFVHVGSIWPNDWLWGRASGRGGKGEKQLFYWLMLELADNTRAGSNRDVGLRPAGSKLGACGLGKYCA